MKTILIATWFGATCWMVVFSAFAVCTGLNKQSACFVAATALMAICYSAYYRKHKEQIERDYNDHFGPMQ